jgi:REP element-mobilizing transposase RayT
VAIPPQLRRTVLEAFVKALIEAGWRVLVASCSDKHLHALAELPASRDRTKQIVGQAKRAASLAVRREMPGSIWSAGGEYKPVKDRRHQVETFQYIRERQEAGAHAWHFRRPLR